jgi:hypothetical protein
MRILITILTLLYLVPTHAQSGYLKSYALDFDKVYFTGMVIEADTMLISALTLRSDTFNTQNLLIVKVDTNGVVLDYFIHKDSLGADYAITFGGKSHAMLKCSNGSGYIVTGFAAQRGLWNVIKFAPNGQIQWIKEYPDVQALTEHFIKIIEVDGGYLIGGNKQALNGKSDIFAMKIDLSGNKVWERKYGVGNNLGDYFSDMLKLDNNQIVISGSASPGNVPVEERMFISKIFAIDSLGGFRWSWEGEPSLDQTVRGLHRDDDGNWAYTSIYVAYESNGTFKGQPKFVKRDSTFNLLKEKELDDADAFFNYFLTMIPLSDGGYLGTGVNYQNDDPPLSYAWMCRMDENGEVLWERKDRTFTDSSFSSIQFLHSACELPRGNLIATGYMNTPYDLGILIKVTKDGCIDTLCTTTSILDQIARLQAPINVYPNPASEYLIFEMNERSDPARAEIFDMTGRRVQWSFVKSGINVVMLDHQLNISGLYAWRVVSEHGTFLQSGKVMITAD